MGILARINKRLVPQQRLAAINRAAQTGQKDYNQLDAGNYQKLLRILIKSGKLSDLLSEPQNRELRAFNTLRLPPEERRFAAWLNLHYLVMENPPIFRSRIPPEWHFDRAGVLEIDATGKRQRYEYREDIQELVAQHWEKTDRLADMPPELPTGTLEIRESIASKYGVRILGGLNVHQTARLEGFLFAIHPEDLKQLRSIRKEQEWGSALMAYDHVDRSMYVYETTLNELDLETADTTLHRNAQLTMHHEFGHARFDQMTSETYQEFLAINGYSRDFMGSLKKLALWITWGIDFMHDAKDLIKTEGWYYTARLCSRFLDSMTMETDKNISGYTTDYGRTNLMEDFAEQFGYHRGLPNVYDKFADQSAVIRANRKFFMEHFPNVSPWDTKKT
ncbi:MAG: hypothetical protein ABIE84_06190 [bacterium]